MPTLRQYATAQQLANISGIDISLLTDNLIGQAEASIDRYCANFYQAPLSRVFWNNIQSTVSTTTTTLTLPANQSQNANYYKYCVARLSNGLELPVLSSANNILTIPLTSGLSGTYECQIYQLGKFPRVCDSFGSNKFIIQDLLQAVAYQVAFMIENSKKVSGVKTGTILTLNQKQKQSESIGENYSYTVGAGDNSLAGGKGDTIAERVSPLARDILDTLGMSYQSHC